MEIAIIILLISILAAIWVESTRKKLIAGLLGFHQREYLEFQ